VKANRVLMMLVVLSVVTASVIAACGDVSEEVAEDPISIDGQVLLEERCTDCHSLGRVTGAEKTRDEWEDTVTRMVNLGARLNDEEQTALIDYLAQTYGP